MERSPLYEAAKTLVQDWQDRVSLGYEGGWPQMEDLAEVLDDIDQALMVLDEFRDTSRMEFHSLSMYINSRGLVYVIQLPADHPFYGRPRDLQGEKVHIDGGYYEIMGVETYCVPEGHSALKGPCGLLVIPASVDNPAIMPGRR